MTVHASLRPTPRTSGPVVSVPAAPSVPPADPTPSLPADLRAFAVPHVSNAMSHADPFADAKAAVKADGHAPKYASDAQWDMVIRSVIAAEYIEMYGSAIGGTASKEAFAEGARLARIVLQRMGDENALGSTDVDAPGEAFKQAVDDGVQRVVRKNITPDYALLKDDQLAMFRPVVESTYNSDLNVWYSDAEKKSQDDGLATGLTTEQLERIIRSLIVEGFIARDKTDFQKLTADKALDKGTDLGKSALTTMGTPTILGSTDRYTPGLAFKQAVDAGIATKHKNWFQRVAGWVPSGRHPSRERLFVLALSVIIIGLTALAAFATWGFTSVISWLVIAFVLVVLFVAIKRWRKGKPVLWLLAILLLGFLIILVVAFAYNRGRFSSNDSVQNQQLQSEYAACASNGNCAGVLIQEHQTAAGILGQLEGVCNSAPGNAKCAKYAPEITDAGGTFPTTPNTAYDFFCRDDATLVGAHQLQPNQQCAAFKH